MKRALLAEEWEGLKTVIASILSTSEQTDERRRESMALEGRSQVLVSQMKGGLGFIACLHTRLIITVPQISHNVLQGASTHNAD